MTQPTPLNRPLDVSDEEARVADALDQYIASRSRGERPEVPLELQEFLGVGGGGSLILGLVDALDELAPSPRPAPQLETAYSSRMEAETAEAAAMPREFGPYTLLHEIDRGGMGIVYRAEHRSLGAQVAIKVIRDEHWASRDDVRRFHQEARSAAQLSHPGIVKVYDAGELSGVQFLVMELIKGGDLGQMLMAGNLSPADAARLLSQVARAIEYLHGQGIVHRDLKPANILLDESGHPKVTDFGLAKLMTDDSRMTSTGAILGTPAYMAPEQAWSRPAEVTARSDIYGLGAILYETLTGRPPFEALNPLEVLLKVRDAEPMQPRSIRASVPRELQQICMRCLEKKPADRYESARALADDLDAYLRGEPVSVVPRSWREQALRWARRHPALSVHWAGIGLATTVSQVRYLSGETQPHQIPITAVLLLWMALSWLLQRGLSSFPSARLPRMLWLIADAVLFTLVIWMAERPVEPLLLGYALLIVASGLWLRVEYVLLMTGASILGSLLIVNLRGDPAVPIHYWAVLQGLLALIGSGTAYQVHRLTLLGRFLGQRE